MSGISKMQDFQYHESKLLKCHTTTRKGDYTPTKQCTINKLHTSKATIRGLPIEEEEEAGVLESEDPIIETPTQFAPYQIKIKKINNIQNALTNTHQKTELCCLGCMLCPSLY